MSGHQGQGTLLMKLSLVTGALLPLPVGVPLQTLSWQQAAASVLLQILHFVSLQVKAGLPVSTFF